MPKFDWKGVKREDVIKAINLFLADNPEYPSPRNTYLIYDGMKLPAKHIRGMAYKVAYNQEISKEDYTGGMETVRFFERLGFEMYYTGATERKDKSKKKSTKNKSVLDNESVMAEAQYDIDAEYDKQEKRQGQTISLSDKVKISSKGVIEQKNALQLLLNKMFEGDIVCEKTFEWMKTPAVLSGEYVKLYNALRHYRQHEGFAKKNVALRCDFVCMSKKLIIEYDERQHFSEARRLSLLSYANIPMDFDRELWIKACEDIQAKDNQPVDRDEIRAYYDSVRDIEAYKHGFRLIRIMHGQMDFTADGAYEKLKEVIGGSLFEMQESRENPIQKDIKTKESGEKKNLKIAMYLQCEQWKNHDSFKRDMAVVKKADVDILVFPEVGWVYFEDMLANSDIVNEDDINRIFDKCEEFSMEMGCALVISSRDKYDTLFSIFVNHNAQKGDTRCQLYIKHTMTQYSAFDLENYQEFWGKALFEPIKFKGYLIGLTICYDCNHALFSRMYGVQGVDIIINSTGGDVKYDKWYKYNSARAIENSCYTFVTMGGDGKKDSVNSYVYGFNRNGKSLHPTLLNGSSDMVNVAGGIYLYELSTDDGEQEPDKSLGQVKSVNKKRDFVIPVGDVDSVLEKAEKVSEKLYVLKNKDKHIVFCVVEDDAIFYAENFLPDIYSPKLDKYKNRRYILVNKYPKLDRMLYENKLSVILKVRAMENFCAVILESDIENNCYQTGMNRTAQMIQPENNVFGLDLSRATGPDAIWKNKIGMRASWRNNFIWLANECKKISESNNG